MRSALQKLTLLALAGAALAAAPAEERVQLKSGQWLVGTAKGYDETTKLVAWVDESGQTRTIHVDELDPRSAYRVANSRAKDADAETLIRIGNFARDIELFAHAARHYHDAVDKDPKVQAQVDEQVVTLKRRAAEFCVRNAKEAWARGDAKETEKWLSTLVTKLPDEPEAKEAQRLLAEHYAKTHAAQDDEYEDQYKNILETDLKTGKRHYDNMLEKIETALTSDSGSKSKSTLASAYKDGEGALKELDKVQKKLAKDDPSTELSELFDGYRKIVKDHMVEAQLHLASFYTASTSYQQALKEVNKALALDPGNQEVLAARARIETAASRGWRW